MASRCPGIVDQVGQFDVEPGIDRKAAASALSAATLCRFWRNWTAP